jgi:uncharacterized membrane protein YqjE
MMQSARNDHSLGELFTDLAAQSAALVRGEIAIAKAELTQTAKKAAKDVGMLIIGGLVIYAGLLALLAAAIIALASALPAWLAAFIVGLIVLLVGAAVISRGRAALAGTSLAPRQTIETLAADVEVVKGERG